MNTEISEAIVIADIIEDISFVESIQNAEISEQRLVI